MEAKKAEMEEKRYLAVSRKVFKLTVSRPEHVRIFRDTVKAWGDIKEQYEYGVSFYKRSAAVNTTSYFTL